MSGHNKYSKLGICKKQMALGFNWFFFTGEGRGISSSDSDLQQKCQNHPSLTSRSKFWAGCKVSTVANKVLMAATGPTMFELNLQPVGRANLTARKLLTKKTRGAVPFKAQILWKPLKTNLLTAWCNCLLIMSRLNDLPRKYYNTNSVRWTRFIHVAPSREEVGNI